ncbi:MAG: type II secretion system protein, partial [Sporomusa sp.]
MNNNRTGSLLLEIAIAVAALGILLAVVMPKYADTVDTAKKSADMAQISAIATAVATYRFETKQYPTQLLDLTKKSGDLGPWLPALPATNKWGDTITINGSGGDATSPYCYA